MLRRFKLVIRSADQGVDLESFQVELEDVLLLGKTRTQVEALVCDKARKENPNLDEDGDRDVQWVVLGLEFIAA